LATSVSPPDLYFDGQRIDVLWENDEGAVEWLKTRLGWNVQRREDWKVDPACLEGRMTQLDYGTWVVSYRSEGRLAHHFADREGPEPNVRLCLRVHDLEALHERFSAEGVRVTSIYDGPKARYFDAWAEPEPFRLTFQEDRSLPEQGVHPSWIRIGVRNVDEALKWHEAHTGMRLVERNPDGRFAVAALKLNHAEGEDSLWVLEQLPSGASTEKANGRVQPVCWIKSRDEFFQYNERLRSAGVETSEVGGFVERGMVGFHFYDPDGNRFNVSSM